MRRYKALLISIFFIATHSMKGQNVDVVYTGAFGATGIHFESNELYISLASQNRLVKIDVLQSTPSITDITSVISSPYHLEIDNNNVFITEFNAGRVSRFNIDSSTLSIVASNLEGPNGVVLKENYLYVSEYNAGTISRIDLDSPQLTREIIASDLSGPSALIFDEEVLYFSEYISGAISRINTSDSNPLAFQLINGLEGPDGIALDEGVLYIAETLGKKISKIDLNSNFPVSTNLISNLDNPIGIDIYENDLYIAESTTGQILKIDLDLTSSLKESAQDILTLYPNPVQNHLYVRNLETEREYHIYDFKGIEISTGIINPKQSIKTSELSKGNYFIKIDGIAAMHFIKI